MGSLEKRFKNKIGQQSQDQDSKDKKKIKMNSFSSMILRWTNLPWGLLMLSACWNVQSFFSKKPATADLSVTETLKKQKARIASGRSARQSESRCSVRQLRAAAVGASRSEAY